MLFLRLSILELSILAFGALLKGLKVGVRPYSGPCLSPSRHREKASALLHLKDSHGPIPHNGLAPARHKDPACPSSILFFQSFLPLNARLNVKSLGFGTASKFQSLRTTPFFFLFLSCLLCFPLIRLFETPCNGGRIQPKTSCECILVKAYLPVKNCAMVLLSFQLVGLGATVQASAINSNLKLQGFGLLRLWPMKPVKAQGTFVKQKESTQSKSITRITNTLCEDGPPSGIPVSTVAFLISPSWELRVNCRAGSAESHDTPLHIWKNIQSQWAAQSPQSTGHTFKFLSKQTTSFGDSTNSSQKKS